MEKSETLSDKEKVSIISMSADAFKENYVGERFYPKEDVKEFIKKDTELIMKHFPMNSNMIALMSDRKELAGDNLI